MRIIVSDRRPSLPESILCSMQTPVLLPILGPIIEESKIDYNLQWPHTSLDGLTPNEFARRARIDHNVNRASL